MLRLIERDRQRQITRLFIFYTVLLFCYFNIDNYNHYAYKNATKTHSYRCLTLLRASSPRTLRWRGMNKSVDEFFFPHEYVVWVAFNNVLGVQVAYVETQHALFSSYISVVFVQFSAIISRTMALIEKFQRDFFVVRKISLILREWIWFSKHCRRFYGC